MYEFKNHNMNFIFIFLFLLCYLPNNKYACSKGQHLHDLIDWDLGIFKASESNSARRRTKENPVEILYIPKIHLVKNSRHCNQQLVLADFVRALLRKPGKDGCQINALLLSCILGC